MDKLNKSYRVIKVSLFLTMLGLLTVFQNCGSNTKGGVPNTTVPDSNMNGNTDPTVNPTPDPTPTCSITDLEQAMKKTFSEVQEPYPASTTTVPFNINDFSFIVERADGRQFSINGANANVTDLYESASTSKLVAAVIILRSVDKGALNLDDHPQKHILNWTIDSTKPLYSMTLRNLLSFTSGLTDDPLCIYNPTLSSSYENCVLSIGIKNKNNTVIPGTQFHYDQSHLQVAGFMTVKARGGSITTWQDLFSEFKNETGLFPTSSFDIPTSESPLLAGGMHWKATEYLAFLKALKNGALLSSAMMKEILSDQTNLTPSGDPVVMEYSPIFVGIGEVWHYGFGSWQECQSTTTYNCAPGTRISSPGAYGSYPYWDRSKDYIGVIAHKSSESGNFPKGVGVERGIRTQVEAWVNCH